MIRKLILLAAGVAGSAMAPSAADAVNLAWSYDPYPDVASCLSRARMAAERYGFSNISAGSNHVQGALEPDMFVTIFCFSNDGGALGLITVAADSPSASYEETIGVKDEIRSLMRN